MPPARAEPSVKRRRTVPALASVPVESTAVGILEPVAVASNEPAGEQSEDGVGLVQVPQVVRPDEEELRALAELDSDVSYRSHLVRRARVFDADEAVGDDELPVFAGPAVGSASVAAHLDDAIKRKVTQGRYVALSTLLPSHRAMGRLSGADAVSAPRRLYKFQEWLDAFLVYAAARIEAHAKEGGPLIKYIQTVKRVHDKGGNFVRYDEAFRAK